MSSDIASGGLPVCAAADRQVNRVIGSLLTTVEETEQSCTGQLARFFPGVRPWAASALVELRRHGATTVREAVLVEFAGPAEAIFASALPLEFEDEVSIENDRGQRANAKVIAVQHHQGKSAVAVKILNGPFSWMTRP